jgi:hypothetical protein
VAQLLLLPHLACQLLLLLQLAAHSSAAQLEPSWHLPAQHEAAAKSTAAAAGGALLLQCFAYYLGHSRQHPCCWVQHRQELPGDASPTHLLLLLLVVHHKLLLHMGQYPRL